MAHATKRWRRFESLESRVMLAADIVTAVVTNHNLVITATGNDYDIVVDGDGTPGDVVIGGYANNDGISTQFNGTENGVPVTEDHPPGSGSLDAPSITFTGVTGNITIDMPGSGMALNFEFLTVDKNLTITAGDSGAGLLLEEVQVSGDTTITAGSGNVNVQFMQIIIGGNLSISAGNGNDEILQQATSVGGNESISLGSGANSVEFEEPTIQADVISVPPTPLAPSIVGPVVSIKGNLLVQLGSGNSTFYAADTHVGGTLIATGSSSLDVAGNVSSAVRAAAIALPASAGHGAHAFADKSASPAAIAAPLAATDSVTFINDTAAGAGIFTGVADTDTVTIQGSTFGDLGVGLGAGKGSLSIGTTTTNSSTILIGLGTSNTYTDWGGNSFANLYTQGLTPPPTATSPPATAPPLTTPVVKQQSVGRHSWQ
jgi:large repetitive protein